ncbi:uncharacterized protein FA14DRAFT_149530 [Meira miltonrushii]|uniref:peptidylprolyl isomerase n=1 Tax=Meira miltonrushii TaxID=1280837 RepID=A0A316V5J2_9BASI|nr:uncharacterized protein FA14DRAFT_149530 [Meira miltonrushii]PWN32820.1 hypothetical protein FA14DRAFT_149530 [Meira miltonrushii]
MAEGSKKRTEGSIDGSEDEVRLKRARKEDVNEDGGAKPTQQPHSFLDALPSATRYYRSLMHRDVLTFVLLTPHTDFLLTASADGHVKFWKKQEQGIEFVKNYRAHLAPVTGLCCSADGSLAASISSDGTAKIYDVVNFDLINMIKLNHTPRACCWVHKRGRADSILAISEEGSTRIRMYDGRGDGQVLRTIEDIHRAPCHILAYNEPYDCIVSADTSGMVECWSANEPFEVPKGKGIWDYKSKTDLFAFKKAKCTPTSLTFSPDFEKFVTMSAIDRQIRIFDFRTGKLIKQYDESIQAAQESQKQAEQAIKETEEQKSDEAEIVLLDSMEFGRRLAGERDIDASSADASGDGVRASMGGCAANVVFDESSTYIVYGSMLGIKVRNIINDKVEAILGKDETMRFVNVSLFQGVVRKKTKRSLALVASENPIIANAQPDMPDPTLFCTAFKRSRFYMFTREEPDNDPKSKSGAERDIFNEKPTREEQSLAAAAAQTGISKRSNVASSAVLHTTMGDIHLRLFPEHAPKTVENFVGLAKKGYYDNIIFHRIIKKFMLQTGDPLGDGTGGESLWGNEFQDEFSRQLRHDRPYVLSMANAGPNTNGSQFFITTVPTPWLDDKHTIFGRASGGFDVIHSIENAPTNRNTDKPLEDISILNITLDVE